MPDVARMSFLCVAFLVLFVMLFGRSPAPPVALAPEPRDQRAFETEQSALLSEDERLKKFVAAIRTEFERYASAEFAVVSLRMQLREARGQDFSMLESQASAAKQDLARVVEINWPFDEGQTAEARLEYANAGLELNSLISRANVGGQPPLDKSTAIARITEIAERYPDSHLSSGAYHQSGILHLQEKPPERAEANRMFRLVADSKAPLSGWRILSMTNLASSSPDDTQRMEDRLRFSEQMRELRDPARLEEVLLPPQRLESPQEYVHRIGGALVSIEAHYALNSINVLSDAQRAGGMSEVRTLIEREKDNVYLQQEAKRRGWDNPAVKMPER